MQYLSVLVVLFIVVELVSIVVVAQSLGGLATLGLIILCFMAGSFLMKRRAGLSKLVLAGGLLRSGGQLSFYQMLYPIRIPFAAFLLMLPGFFSDIIAVLLLLPFGSADTDSNTSQSTFEQREFRFGTQQRTRPNDDDIIEGDFVVRSDADSHAASQSNKIDRIEYKK